MLMAHITTTAVFLVLLLSSASVNGSTGIEYNAMTIPTESHGDKQDNANIIKELQMEMTKYQRGRKMGGFEVKKDTTKTGMITETETKPTGCSPKDAGKKDTRKKTQISKVLAQPGANQNLEPHFTDDVIKELSNLIIRDYHQTARRRGPINNAIPLDDEEP